MSEKIFLEEKVQAVLGPIVDQLLPQMRADPLVIKRRQLGVLTLTTAYQHLMVLIAHGTATPDLIHAIIERAVDRAVVWGAYLETPLWDGIFTALREDLQAFYPDLDLDELPT